MPEYWKPLSPRSIAILTKLSTEIHAAEQYLDRTAQRSEYKATPNIQIIEGIDGTTAGPGDQAQAWPAERFPQ